MPTKSRKFRVATEGATTDGRTIQREWLVQAAKNYDPKTFTALVNIEHIRSAYPDSTFRNYGKITAVEAKEEDGKMRLYAEIEPLPDLVTLTQAGQKLFTSIEINPKFADTDQAYLVGVAVTDNPASLGTEVLSFAAKNPKASPFAARKQHPDTLFTEAVETALAFDDEPDDTGTFTAKLREVLAKFSSKKTGDDTRFSELLDAMGQICDHLGEQSKAFAAQKKRADQAETQFTALKAEVDQLKATVLKIDTTPAPGFTQRPAATGSSAGSAAQTDC